MSKDKAMKVGITGIIGAGKSTVSSYLIEQGYRVFDADKMVHELYNLDALKIWVSNEFGADIIDASGSIDRKSLAKIVFNNPKKLQKLEDKLYPMVKDAIREIDDTNEMLFFEVPLLFEAGFEDLFDSIISVVADSKIRYNRLMGRGLTLDDIKSREARQWNGDMKIAHSNYFINNSFDLDMLYKSMDELLERIKND